MGLEEVGEVVLPNHHRLLPFRNRNRPVGEVPPGLQEEELERMERPAGQEQEVLAEEEEGEELGYLPLAQVPEQAHLTQHQLDSSACDPLILSAVRLTGTTSGLALILFLFLLFLSLSLPLAPGQLGTTRRWCTSSSRRSWGTTTT